MSKPKTHYYDPEKKWEAGTKTWIPATCGTPVAIGREAYFRLGKVESPTCLKCQAWARRGAQAVRDIFSGCLKKADEQNLMRYLDLSDEQMLREFVKE